jgi:zinc transport system substrate-binding protein
MTATAAHPTSRRALVAAGALLLLLLAPARAARAAEPPRVLVTVPPHASLVQRLAGDAVTVEVVLEPGESPGSFAPTPRRIQRLATARLWLTTGAPLEPSLADRLAAAAPGLVIVPTHARLEFIADAAGHAHADAAGHDHDHGELDPHVWLSARNTLAQVAVMAGALGELLPERRGAIATAQRRLEEELRALDAELGELLAPLAGRTIFVFHPAFGYFARDYDLRQEAIERGGLPPGPRHLAGLLETIRATGATTIFLQPQYSDQLVRGVAAEAGLEVVVLDPLARDHLANLRHIGASIAAALEASP